MTSLEEQLKQAMARREPPADFSQRVLARVEQEQRQEREKRTGRLLPVVRDGKWQSGLRTWFQTPRAWRLVGAVAVLLAVSGSVMHEQHERMVRGEAAKEKLLLAVRIAGVKLHQAHRHVLQVEAEVDQ